MAGDVDLTLTAQRLGFSDERHYLGRPCRRGHIFADGKTWRARNGHACVLCKREIALEWKQAHPERARESTRRRDGKRRNTHVERRRRWPFALHTGTTRAKSRKRGIPYELTVDTLKALWAAQGGRCYWTNKELDFWAGGPRHMFRPSIDRLEPAKGYVPGNVVWASNFANHARGATPAHEFAAVMREFGFTGPYLEAFPA